MGAKGESVKVRMLPTQWRKLNYLIHDRNIFGSKPHAFKKCFQIYLEQYEAENGEIEV